MTTAPASATKVASSSASARRAVRAHPARRRLRARSRREAQPPVAGRLSTAISPGGTPSSFLAAVASRNPVKHLRVEAVRGHGQAGGQAPHPPPPLPGWFRGGDPTVRSLASPSPDAASGEQGVRLSSCGGGAASLYRHALAGRSLRSATSGDADERLGERDVLLARPSAGTLVDSQPKAAIPGARIVDDRAERAAGGPFDSVSWLTGVSSSMTHR